MFAITFIIGIVARVLTLNFTQHWIHSRVNEKMWIEDDILNHFFQVSWGPVGIQGVLIIQVIYLKLI